MVHRSLESEATSAGSASMSVVQKKSSCSDVVALLREEKGLPEPARRRQIIAATHNANIPVLGDAELVLALEAGEDRCHVVGRASIDNRETRQQIKSLLEGGDEAFRRRAEKYGGGS